MTTLDELIDAQLAADVEAARKAEEERQERVRVNKATAIAKMGERLFWSLGKDLFDLLPLEYEAFTYREYNGRCYSSDLVNVHHVTATAPVYQDVLVFTFWPHDDEDEGSGLCQFHVSGQDSGYSDRATVLRALAKAREFDRTYPIECVPA